MESLQLQHQTSSTTLDVGYEALQSTHRVKVDAILYKGRRHNPDVLSWSHLGQAMVPFSPTHVLCQWDYSTVRKFFSPNISLHLGERQLQRKKMQVGIKMGFSNGMKLSGNLKGFWIPNSPKYVQNLQPRVEGLCQSYTKY